jgi:opacity protein-like surface antigen
LKKLAALFLILAAFLSLNNTTFSQPQLKLHVTGGYNLPLPDFKGEQTFTTIEKDTYGMKQGFNVGADVKYYLGKKRNVGITLGLNYNMFSNNVDTTLNSTAYTQKNKINIFQAAIGIEYNFMPKGKTQPFLGLGLTGNFFSGSSKVEPALTGSTETTLKSASRFGLRVGGGIDFMLSKSVGAVIGFNYNMANLVGKDSDTSFVAGQTEFPLNDKEFTVGTVTTKSRNISYLQAYAGVSFYFNQPKKTVKK